MIYEISSTDPYDTPRGDTPNEYPAAMHNRIVYRCRWQLPNMPDIDWLYRQRRWAAMHLQQCILLGWLKLHVLAV